MVPWRLLPLAPAERLHQLDRLIPRGRPRAVARDVRRPGRWDDDRRTPRPCGLVDGDRGRQWIIEVEVRKIAGTLVVLCIVKTDERSKFVSSSVSASQPRVIQYIANNAFSRKDHLVVWPS